MKNYIIYIFFLLFYVGRAYSMHRTMSFSHHPVQHLSTFIQYGDLNAVDRLITVFEASPHAANSAGVTPLICAVESGHLAIVRYLIEQHKVAINIRDNRGRTPLSIAIHMKYIEIRDYLIARGALSNESHKNKMCWLDKYVRFFCCRSLVTEQQSLLYH